MNLDRRKRVVFWLSFADSASGTFLGVSIVEVAKHEAVNERADLIARFGRVRPNADWFSAAIRKAWRLGINPGGEVQAAALTERESIPEGLPVNAALTQEQIERYGIRAVKE